MKLKYTFEEMVLDGKYVAIPVGKNAAQLHAVLNLNEEARDIVECLKHETTISGIVEQLSEKYDATVDELMKSVVIFVNQLRSEGLLEE